MASEKDEVIVSSTSDTEEEIKEALGEEGEEEEPEEQEEESTGEKTEEGEKEESEEEKGKKETKEDSKEESEGEEEEDRSKWPKWRKKMQKRIDTLTARLGKEKAEEVAEEEAEEDEEEIPTPGDRPKRTAFKTQEEYEDAVADWRYDQRKEKEAQDALALARKNEYDDYMVGLNKFKAEQEDFDEVFEEAKGINIPEAVQVAIIQAKRWDIAYEIAKTPEFAKELIEINKTSPARSVLALGKFVTEFDAKKAKHVPKKEAVKAKAETEEEEPPKKKALPPAAKAPITPVKGGSAKTQKKALNEDDIPFEEYKRRRAAGES